MTEAEMPIGFEKTTLGGALKNGPLRVPPFQREYSWKPDRVSRLFDDIKNAMTKRQTSYFVGIVVLTPGRPPCVIDGQQRLATTTIFLAAVRDALLELGREKAAKSVEDDFLWEYRRQEDEYIPRLTLNVDDRAYMQGRVLDRPSERENIPPTKYHSHRLIDQAAHIAAKRVSRIIAEADKVNRKVEELDAWIEFIHRNAIIVMLTPPNAARAFQMYKTLNDRAQRTTPADMVKNHLFEQAGDGGIDEAQSKWSSMRTIIEHVASAGEDGPLMTYLHHFSITRYGPIKLEEIFERMEDKITGRTTSLKFLDALANHAADYAAIAAPDHSKWTNYDARVRRSVDHVSQEIKMTFIRPLMLAVAANFTARETRAIASWDTEKPLLLLAEEYLHEEIVVPTGLLALAGDADLLLARRPLEQR